MHVRVYVRVGESFRVTDGQIVKINSHSVLGLINHQARWMRSKSAAVEVVGQLLQWFVAALSTYRAQRQYRGGHIRGWGFVEKPATAGATVRME